MSGRYVCGSEQRRRRLLEPGVTFNGIDYLEVHTPSDIQQPTTLEIVFLKPDQVATLTAANVRIEGGVRFRDPPIAQVVTTPGSSVLTVMMLGLGPPPQPQFPRTDYSTYRLRLVDATGDAPPAGFDPQLSTVEFSFKVDCPSPFDCAPVGAAATAPSRAEPELDYTARDWPTFRRLMLDRLAALLPEVPLDTPVDFLTTQVEALAAVADHLSYRIDAVAAERTLFTARSRVSLARHARLLDYAVHEGCSARTFVQFRFEPSSSAPDGTELRAQTPVVPARPGVGARVTPALFAGWLADPPLVFETAHPVRLWAGNDSIAFHTWSDDLCHLPRGATRATLRKRRDSAAPEAVLEVGDFLLLHRIADPANGERHDDRRFRHLVRLTAVTPGRDPVEGVDVLEVAWAVEDALPFDLVLSAEVDRGGRTERIECAEAAANLALADHGVTLPPKDATPSQASALAPTLDPPSAPDRGAWRPLLSRSDLARIVPCELGEPRRPASAFRQSDPGAAVPALTLTDTYGAWTTQHTLLASQRFARDVMVETESDGRVLLRFGDRVAGVVPPPGSSLRASGRFGRPSDGRIGADVLALVATDVEGIVAVRNPLPAFGACEPVPATVVRIEAPQAFRSQKRAVTEQDWAVVAERYPGVQRALARIRWTGAWRTAFVYVDREGGRPVEGDRVFLAGLTAHLERHRLAGGDVTIRGAVAVPLEVALRVCVCPGTLRAEVLRALLERLGSGIARDGTRGFFHPDNFTFGTPLYLSGLLAAALEVSGVASAEAIEFRPWARSAAGELAAGVIAPGDLQVLQLSNDPSFPEQGRLGFELLGGL